MTDDANIVLECIDIHKYFSVSCGGFLRPAARVRALDGVSFRLAAGRTLAVVGESGCGKSTLARCAALIEAPSSGSVVYSGENPHKNKLLRPTVQMVFQDSLDALNPRKTAGESLAEPLAINGRLSATQRRDAALAMLARVGLGSEHLDRYPHMLSGGQRQRVAIARALMLRPKAVIADEPVSALDVSVQAQVLDLLAELQAAFGVAYLFVSHDLNVVRRVADEVMVMYFGRPVEIAPAAALFAVPRHPYAQALLAAAPRLSRAALKHPPTAAALGEPPSPLDPPPGCAFHPRCPRADARCRVEAPALRALDAVRVACHHAEQ